MGPIVVDVPRIRAGAALATVLVAAVLTGCQFTSVKDEAVELVDASNAFVVSGGTERPARSGDSLGKGDGVLTRAGGRVTLEVRDRRVVLGADTQVVVPDGETVDLARGALLVDRRRGPGVTVRAGDTTVDNVGTGALRIERAFSVLVAGLSTGARVRTATGARLGLEELYQVVVAGRSLPRTGLPLQLRHDAWEKEVVAGVVADDARLNDLAEGLDGPGAPVIPASYTVNGGARATDLVLADAIGWAAANSDAERRREANRARVLRGEGGSWGVVAHLLDARVADVGEALAGVLNGLVVAAPEEPAPSRTPGAVAGRSPQPGVTRSPSPTSTRSTAPGTSAPPTETSSPTETPNAVESILSALPTPLVPLLR